MKLLKKIGMILLCVAVVIGLCFALPRPQASVSNPFLIDAGARPLLIAHGGGNEEFPDNTLEAFYHAYSIDPGCMLETDVSLTKDGVVILCHDRTLDRTTDVSGEIIDWTYADLVSQEVDFGFKNPTTGDNGTKLSDTLTPYTTFDGRTVTPTDVSYPQGVTPRHGTKFLATTLEQLIKTFPNNTINVEIKQPDEAGIQALDAVIRLMNELDPAYHTFSRIVLASFHANVYEHLKQLKAETVPQLMFSPNESGITAMYATHWVGLDFLYREPVSVLQIPTVKKGLPLDWALFIGAAHRHHMAVHYWTINDEETMRALCAKGADGIMSDRPTLLKKVLDELYAT